MVDAIIIGIVVVLLWFALKGSMKHFKGVVVEATKILMLKKRN